jgi:hypothetical protein
MKSIEEGEGLVQDWTLVEERGLVQDYRPCGGGGGLVQDWTLWRGRGLVHDWTLWREGGWSGAGLHITDSFSSHIA